MAVAAREAVSHTRALEMLSGLFASLVESDPLLSDVSAEAHLEDITTLIALEHGNAMIIGVRKFTGESVTVVVLMQATVKDLKRAIQRKISQLEETKMGSRRISWKYVWKNFVLSFKGTRLTDDRAKLTDIGIRTRDEVAFARRPIRSDD